MAKISIIRTSTIALALFGGPPLLSGLRPSGALTGKPSLAASAAPSAAPPK
jgi:hypothetical protein